MISGFNTDVEHGGQVFHVQTEEKGPDNPVVVTLVYSGGQIVGSREVSYGAAAEASALPEDEIRLRMREQHRVLIREIHGGRFDPPPMPYGHDFVSNRSFDEIVLDYLETAIDEIGAPPAESTPGAGEAAPPDPAASARAAQVSRVLQRLERFLDAAERAGVEPAAQAAPPAPAPDEIAAPVPQPPQIDAAIEAPAARPDRALRPGDAIPTALELTPRPVVHRRGSRSFLVTAPFAAAAAIAVLMLVAPRTFAPSPEPRTAATGERPAPPAAAIEPSPTPASTAVGDTQSIGAPAAPPEAAAPPLAFPSAPIVEPLAAPASRPPRASGPRRRPEPSPARTSVPAPPRQATAIPQPAAPSTPPGELPDLPPTVEETRPAVPGVLPGQLVDLASVDVTPRPRHRDLPRYTSRARRAGSQGTVELRVLIDERGDVADTALVRDDAGADLVEQTLSAVRSWTFSPARKDRQPVKVWQDVALEFTILPNRSTSVRVRE